MTDDAELLRRYADAPNDLVFSELVQRHVGLVYQSALRQTGDAAQAKEITQAVFAQLARAVPSLSGGATLVGWLHANTREVAAHATRPDTRHPKSERLATATGPHHGTPGESGEAERVARVLDDALGVLSEREREVLLLHFLEGRPFAEIGDAYFVSEEAARVRTERALEKLQDLLVQRGVSTTTAHLARVLEEQGGRAAPSGLAASVTTGAVAPVAAGSGARANPGSPKRVRMLAAAAGAVALFAAGAAVLQWQRARMLETTLGGAERQLDEARAETTRLQARLDAALRRAQAADEDNARLIEAMDRLAELREEDTRATPEPPVPITQEQVSGRFRRAAEFARSGRFAEALREYLWCWDDGMPRFAVFAAVRTGSLLGELAELARRYPPAREALRARRDHAEQRMRASAIEREAAADFAALNEALGESARTLREFERLKPDDPRREGLGARVFESLATQKRYREALQARSAAAMRTSFELASSLLAENAAGAKGGGSAATVRAFGEQRDTLARTTARDVEVLAGAGERVEAQALAEALLEFDDSPATRTLLRQSLVRAGHPDLGAGLLSPVR